MSKKQTYLVTCATGNVGGRVARQLLAQGHSVRAFGREEGRLQSLADLGAAPIVGDMHDLSATTAAFDGVDAALLICRGDPSARDYRRDFVLAGETYAEAARVTGLKHAVFVSSLGAHDDRHRGLVLIHGDVEQHLNEVPNLGLVNLRAPMFFENLFYFLPGLRASDELTWAIDPDSLIYLGSTRDVADVAVELLTALDFNGKRALELHGEAAMTTRRIAAIIASVIGRPISLCPATSKGDVAGMMAAGFGRDFSILMNDAWRTFSHGLVREHGSAGARILPQRVEDFIAQALAPAILA